MGPLFRSAGMLLGRCWASCQTYSLSDCASCEGDHSDNEGFFNALGILCREYNNVFLMVTGSDDSYIKGSLNTTGFRQSIISWLS